MDWVVTIPQKIEWSEYQKEIDKVESGVYAMNYRVPYKPKVSSGDRCFVVWRGKVRGWMKITGAVRHVPFQCLTTGKMWKEGWYIQRSGPFYKVDGPDMKGFRGLRKYSP